MPEVLLALTRVAQDGDIQVHEAATDALIALRAHPAAAPLELAASV
jgi:hypothetical protein